MKGESKSLTLQALLTDIKVTFLGLMIDRREGAITSIGKGLRWMVAARECSLMPGDEAFFDYWCEVENCTHLVHPALETWLAARGWYLERYDECWHSLHPMPTDDDRAEWADLAQEAKIARIGPPTRESLDPCPF